MGLPYVPLTFPTVTVRNNAKNAMVDLTNSEVDRLWAAYKVATLERGIRPYTSEAGGGNLAIIQALETATDYTRLKVVAFLNGLEKAVKTQGFGWVWLDPALASQTDPVGGALVDPVAAFKRTMGDIGEALSKFLTPVADPVTNVL